jgi:histidyl-tRNA synthetase
LAEKRKFQAIKGVRDILPPESELWNSVEQSAKRVFANYGYQEIRLPILEQTELFTRSVGQESDIATKEMYTFHDRDESSVSLRPEGTASAVRAYIQNGMYMWPTPVKLYYMGPMFRRERPQKGRYRQFYQIGAELLGPSDSPDIDAEVIEMLVVYLQRVRLRGTELSINSVGCKQCRAGYVEILRTELQKVREQLGADSQRRVETNPLRVLDSKVESEQAIIDKLPRIAEHLCTDCKWHYDEVKRQLDLREIKYQENWRLVRGLDYYMRTTFEITAPGLGSQNAICGGGRYDGLVELLGGPPTKGIGFAIGTDRLVLAIQKNSEHTHAQGDPSKRETDPRVQKYDVVVTGTTDSTWEHAANLASSMRKRGLTVFYPKKQTKLNKVFDLAHKMGIRVAILVGETEISEGSYTIRVLSPLLEDTPRDVRVDESNLLTYGKIVKLRIDLERALGKWVSGEEHAIKGKGLSRIISYIADKRLFPQKITYRLADIIPTLNRAVHGLDKVTDDSVAWALVAGNLLLNEIENLPPSEKSLDA